MAAVAPSVTGPQARFGDLYPLPVGEVEVPRLNHLGRSSRRRVTVAHALDVRCDDTFKALNELAGFHDEANWPRVALNQAQSSVVSRVRHMHASTERPGKVSDEASLRQVLKTSSGYQVSAGELAPYRKGCVSLPHEQGPPAPLCDLLEGFRNSAF